jgi:N-acetylmuramic acid 6-phosphate etherase
MFAQHSKTKMILGSAMCWYVIRLTVPHIEFERATKRVTMKPTTEQRNSASEKLDTLTTVELVSLINREDAAIAAAVALQTETIAAAIDLISAQLQDGGRLIYVGAGTSGRLGVLDASECPPTFNTNPRDVVGIIAGGDAALRNAVEGAEDSPETGAADLRAVNLSSRDVVTGIAASGGTPYVVGALNYAQQVGAKTIALTCNVDSAIGAIAGLEIAVVVGPEVLAGSTRMKAGTATKMVLNLLTTGTMVRLGKSYGNLMVDLQASNRKLRDRAIGIVCAVAGLAETDARRVLDCCDGEVKTAIVCARLNLDSATARQRLSESGGRLRTVLENPGC